MYTLIQYSMGCESPGAGQAENLAIPIEFRVDQETIIKIRLAIFLRRFPIFIEFF